MSDRRILHSTRRFRVTTSRWGACSPHHDNFSSNSRRVLSVHSSFPSNQRATETRGARMFSINRACSLIATIIFRNTISLFLSSSVLRAKSVFHIRKSLRRHPAAYETRFPVVFKGHRPRRNHQPSSPFRFERRHPVKSCDGDRTFKTERS